MKRILVVLTTNAQFSAVLPDDEANELIDQFYKLCSIEIEDQCFEMSLRNESGMLENTLIPIRSILYVQCREFIE